MPSGFNSEEFSFFIPAQSTKHVDRPLTQLGELLREPTPKYQWVVDQLLLRGGFSLLAGKPKSGKSTLSRCLALAVTRGQRFLGRKTVQGGVLLFALEDHRQMLKESFKRLGATGNEDVFVHCGSVNGNPMRQLEHSVEHHQPTLVIVDTVFRFTKCFDTNSYTQVIEALTPLSDLARKTGIHILAVHHAGKAERADSLDSVLGSVGVHGSMDATLLLKRTSQYRVIESQQRYGVDLEPTILSFDSDTGWIDAGLPLADAEATRIGDEIINFLRTCGAPATELDISTAVTGRTQTLRRALRLLVESSQVQKEGSGSRGDAFRYRI